MSDAPIIFKKCKLFNKTFKDYETNKSVVTKFKKFIEWKRENPNSSFGSKDYAFGSGNLTGYGHAGLTFDVSIIYTRKGNTFFLFAIMSHDDAGIGQPANINKQQSLKSKLDNQQFESKNSKHL